MLKPGQRFVEQGMRSLGGIKLGNSACPKCIHIYDNGSTCEAFPEGIPEEILIGKVSHSKPYEGDNGIQFQLNPNLKGR